MRFGRLTVLSLTRVRAVRSCACLCDCGREKAVTVYHLLDGVVRSCGCLRRELLVGRITRHKKSGSKIYDIWIQMRMRCSNPRNKRWGDYGGRGITVCDRWASFDNFLSDMGDRPRGRSLDRIDNNGPYSPENCRWANRREQANNTRSNRLVSVGGKTQSVSAWLRELGGNKHSFYRALRAGRSEKEALGLCVKQEIVNGAIPKNGHAMSDG